MIIERKSAVLFTLLTVGTVQPEVLTLSTARLGEQLSFADSPNTILSRLISRGLVIDHL